MSDKINIEAILSKRIIQFPVDDVMPDEKQIRKNVKAAIKEIVELVIGKIAEDAEIKRDAGQDLNGISIDKESILKIKEEIEYE